MERIYLNLRIIESCRRSSGHRTSDGWVNSYTVSIDYYLTSSIVDAKLPLKACCIFDRFYIEHTSSNGYENDRYGYIDEYNHVNSIDISAFVKELNLSQSKYEFVQTSEIQKYNALQLLINSKCEDVRTSQIISHCNADLERQIKFLKEKNRKEILDQTFPHIKNLIMEDQLDFFSKYEKVNSYPLDLLALYNEYDLLISNILKYKKPPFDNFNDVYTLLTTGPISYFDIQKCTIPHLNKCNNLILFEFLREMEKKYRYDSYESIISTFPHSSSFLAGLCNLYGYLLTEIGVYKCYSMIDWHEYSSLPENQRPVFSFHTRYLFPYFIIALLAEEKELTKEIFFEKYRYQSGFDDIPLIFDARGIYFKNLIPYFKKILQNQNAIEILSILLQKSNIEQYAREQIRNRGILSCKSNKDACMAFVKKTLHSFVDSNSVTI